MKSKRNLIKALALIILVIVGAFVFLNHKNVEPVIPKDTTLSTNKTTVNSDTTLTKIPAEAVTIQNTNSDKNGVCQSMRTTYQNIDEVKRTEKIDTRFINIHKKIDGIIYRLRFFYKDSSENEIPSYLLYKENQDEDDILIEKSNYQKGKQYLRIEKSSGDIIYTEEGFNVGTGQDLFLHYQNKVLKDLQGISPISGEKDFIECRY